MKWLDNLFKSTLVLLINPKKTSSVLSDVDSTQIIESTKQAKKEINMEKLNLESLNLKEIILVDFPNNQYYREESKKTQLVLHHTVSGQGVDGDISWWRKTADRIATAIIIGWDGKIYQCFSSKYWGHHLGISAKNNTQLNMESIGIEIDAWGGLIRYNRQWYPAKWDAKLKQNVANTNVKPIQNVQTYPEGYRGFYGFEKYSDAQIESVRKLLQYWGERYNIPLDYNPTMWDVSKDALNGKAGVWSHTSFRSGKSDCHPQPELINMLKSLTK